MVKVIVGALAAALAMFFLSYLFYASPLHRVAYGSLEDNQAAVLQQSFAANLPRTATYNVPDASTPTQTVAYGAGPIATIHFNRGGFPISDVGTLAAGLFLDFFAAMLIGAALIGIDRRVPDFGSRARLAVLFAVAASALAHLKYPIYFHHDWPQYIYRFIADAVILSAGALVIARWFLGKSDAAPATQAAEFKADEESAPPQ